MAVSNFVSRCINGGRPVVYGDGSQTRDFTYVRDVVRANRRLLDTGAADGLAVNVGSTEAVAVGTLAETVRNRLAPSVEVTFDDRPTVGAEHTHADTSRAAGLLDYEPEHSTTSRSTRSTRG
jgi:UDP-glucose 4-epimerase